MAGPPRIGPSFKPRSLFGPAPGNGHPPPRVGPGGEPLDARVARLEHAYLVRGHLAARLDPLERPRPVVPELDPAFHGLAEPDLARVIAARGPDGRAGVAGDLLARLQATYCGPVGFEFMHLDDPERRRWLGERIDRWLDDAPLAPEAQRGILARLTEATALEEFIQQKYVGRQELLPRGRREPDPAARSRHRERRASRASTRSSSAWRTAAASTCSPTSWARARATIFREFEDADPELKTGRGDVKYHLGYSADWTTAAAGKRPPLPVLQPEPPRVREPGRRWAACAPSRTATATDARRRAWRS